MRMFFPLAALLPALLAPSVSAQQARNPSIGYVFPAGGQRGSTVEVVVGGQNLAGPAQVLIAGAGVRATILGYTRPPTRGQMVQLNQRIQEYRKQNPAAAQGGGRGRIDPQAFKQIARSLGLSDLDLPTFLELGRKLRDPNHQPNPQIEEQVLLRLEIDPDAPLGAVELRLGTRLGLSGPLRFQVGNWPEFLEQEPNDEAPDRSLGGALPLVINGQILPGDVDRFAFRATRGMRLVARVSARQLMPYLADAVPGWFQATLAIYDASGTRLAYADDFHFDPDPVLFFEPPADGEYVLEIKDAIYRGREDFVYRITLGEIPFATSHFPLGGQIGRQTRVELRGWNLPRASLMVDGQGREPGVLLIEPAPAAPPRLFALDTLDESTEKEPNDRPGQAQPITLPMIMNGRIGRPGDTDIFSFEGRVGERIVAEIHARRLGSPLDSVLRVIDGQGRLLAFNDDHPDPASGLLTHHADSWLLYELPADGTYMIQVQDAQNRGGEAYAYRLRVGPPRPDFELRLVPASLSARASMTLPITVHAVRRDGFAGAIRLALDQAPPGFVLSGGLIPAGSDQVRMTLGVPATGAPGPQSLRLIGKADIDGRSVEREAIPSQAMMQAFFYTHLVPTRKWSVHVEGQGRRRPPFRITGPLPAAIPLGGRIPVPVAAPGGTSLDQVELELDGGPEGIRVEGLAAQPGGGFAVTLAAERERARVGLAGNLLIQAFQIRMVPDRRKEGALVRQRVPLGYLPALPFVVVGRSL